MVFVKNDTKPQPGFNVSVLMGNTSTSGQVGLEIEVEGNKFKKEGVPLPWVYHHDGSLRGHDNAEYVLNKPIMFDEVPTYIAQLWRMFAEFGSVLDESNRTSIHVHLNAQSFHLNRLTSFLAMYYTVEELLTEWCGDHRRGNLFCMTARDAPAIITQLRAFIKSGGKQAPTEGVHHYAALNTSALKKFGSLEVRTLRGVSDPTIILDWVAVLERIYNLSADYKDPRVLCDQFSSEGPMAFLEYILGDKMNTILSGIDRTQEEIRDSLYDGIRMAQDLCYCRAWEYYDTMDFKPDPFGRKANKMASRLMQSMGVAEAPPVGYMTAPMQTIAVPFPATNPFAEPEFEAEGEEYDDDD